MCVGGSMCVCEGGRCVCGGGGGCVCVCVCGRMCVCVWGGGVVSTKKLKFHCSSQKLCPIENAQTVN